MLRSHLEISQVLISPVGAQVRHMTLFAIEGLRLRQRMESDSAAISLLLAEFDSGRKQDSADAFQLRALAKVWTVPGCDLEVVDVDQRLARL